MKRYPLIALAAAALALAACGSSSDPSASTRQSPAAAASSALKFSDCMRSHGVPNFPDPIVHGNSIQLSIKAGSGVNPFSPSFKAAQSACGKLIPGGGPAGRGAPSKQVLEQMLAMSECMRSHGITDFPDPTTTAPSGGPGQGGIGAVVGHDGVFLAIPSTINPSSPGFQRAAKTCGFLSPGGGPAPAGGAGSGS